MAEAAVAAPAVTPAPGAPGAGVTPPSAGAALHSVPQEWASGFKEENKAYISQKGFKTPEALAESYKSLEAKLSSRVPDERMLVLPEKVEGDALRPIFERLGAPKEPKGYELPRDEKSDPKVADWLESTFHKGGLTKTQAGVIMNAYSERLQSEVAAGTEARRVALIQADARLQGEWGAEYEKNVNIAKQGAKILGIDPKTLDVLEALQGREVLFKNLQKIGVAVGESNFIDGKTNVPTPLTPEQAQAEINTLMKDQKFGKKLQKGDVEATNKWNELHKIATPGTFQVG